MKKKIIEVYPKPSAPCHCMNVRRASRAVTQFYDEMVKPCGLTIAQLGLLRDIHFGEVKTISELAKVVRIDRTTLNRNLKPLLENGLIAINQGQDSRTRQITLTETGRKTLRAGGALWEEAQAMLRDYLGDEDLAKLTQLLSKLEALVPEK